MPDGASKLAAKTYSVTYDLNGGTGATAPTDADTYTVGQGVTAKAAPTGLVPPTGKTFDGWNTQADGSGTDAAAGRSTYMRSGGLMLYAQWSN